MLNGHTERIETGIGALYFTVNMNEDDVPFEVFATIGRAGSDIAAFTEGLARITSLALRSDVPVHDVARQLMGIGGAHINGFGNGKVLSVPDAMGKALMHHAEHKPDGTSSITDPDLCPQCHQGALRHQEGCASCGSCGYSDC